MTTNTIEARGLHCRYGTFEAVRGIDLHVAAGELFALLGTNGAGKTTTMETLEGHRAPDAGTVRVLGHDPRRARPAVRPRVGIMLQDSGFAPELTVIETLRLWRSLRSRPGAVDLALDRLELGGRRDVAVGQLSGGERRRLDLALAILGEPEVLFLDEPTTGLDPESRQRTWEVVRELLAGGTTVLLTTHYLEEAEALADRLAIMHDGTVAVTGTVTEVVADHPARISFRPSDPARPLPPLPPLRGTATAARPGGPVRVRTAALQQDLAALLAWAGEHDIRLDRLEARHAALDDVFRAVRTAHQPHELTEVAA